MLARLVPVLVCLAVLLSLVPGESSAHAFLPFLNPKKAEPPKVAHLSVYMGVPITESEKSMRFRHPRMQRFIRDAQNVNDKSSTAMIALTDTGVLSGVNPRNGGMAWRRFIDSGEKVHGMFSIDEDLLLIGENSNGTLVARMLMGERGTVDWVYESNETVVAGAPVYGTSWKTGQDDALIVAGKKLHYVLEGKHEWTWDPRGDATVMYVVPFNDRLQIVSIVPKDENKWSFRFSQVTIEGDTETDYTMSHTIDGTDSIVFLPYRKRNHIDEAYHATEDGGPHVAWLASDGVLRSQRIVDGDVVLKELHATGAPFERIQDVGLGNRGIFLAHHTNGESEVVEVTQNGDMNPIWTFSEFASDAVYDGGYDLKGDAYVMRMYYEPSQRMLNQHVYRVDEMADNRRGLMTGLAFKYDYEQRGRLRAVLGEYRRLDNGQLAVRCVMITQSGSVHMLRDGTQEWMIEQGLSAPQRTLLVPLPNVLLGRQAVSSRALQVWPLSIETLENESFIDRWLRHFRELRDVRTNVGNFVRGPLYRAAVTVGLQIESLLGHDRDMSVEKRVAGGPRLESEPTDTQQEAPAEDSDAVLYHDRFGFNHMVLTATRYGKMYGINMTLDGSNMVWERTLVPYPQVGGLESHFNVTHLIQTRATNTLHFDRAVAPVAAVVAEVRVFPESEGDDEPSVDTSAIETHVFHLNPLTGEPLSPLSDQRLCAGKAHDIYVQDGVVGAVCADGEFVLPDTTVKTHLVRRDEDALHGVLIDDQMRVPTWRMALAPSERIVAMRDVRHESVAGLGKVRGDRSVLYKYLNPHARAIVTYDAVLASLHVYIVDVVSGDMQYHLMVPDVASADMHVTFVENWLAVQYIGTNARAPNMLLSVELFEREAQGKSGLLASSLVRGGTNGTMAASAPPLAYAQTYALPFKVNAMDTTRTALGVTLRTIVLATNESEVVMLPRRLIDPRRPLGTPTPAEREERLMPYNGGILLNETLPRLTSEYERAAHMDLITTSPALLESSSMVLATGVDWVYTVASPSGQFDRLHTTFSKTQLLLTIAALVLGIVITRPLVRARALNARW